MVYRFYCMALFHSQTRRHMINEKGVLVKLISPNVAFLIQHPLWNIGWRDSMSVAFLPNTIYEIWSYGLNNHMIVAFWPICNIVWSDSMIVAFLTQHHICYIGYSKCMIVAFLIQHPACKIGWSDFMSVASLSNTLYHVYEILIKRILRV